MGVLSFISDLNHQSQYRDELEQRQRMFEEQQRNQRELVDLNKRADIERRNAEIDSIRRAKDIEHVGQQQEKIKFLTTAIKARTPGIDDASAAQMAMNTLAQMETSEGMAASEGNYNKEIGAKSLRPFIPDSAEATAREGITSALAGSRENQLRMKTAEDRYDTAPGAATAQDTANTSGFQLKNAQNQGLIPNAGRAAGLGQDFQAIQAKEGIDQAAQLGEVRKGIPTSALIGAEKARLAGGSLGAISPLLHAPIGSPGDISRDEGLKPLLQQLIKEALTGSSTTALPAPQALGTAGGITPQVNKRRLNISDTD